MPTIKQVFSPTWGPQNQRFGFLFKSRTDTLKESLYTALADGTDIIEIAELQPPRFFKVSWAPKNGDQFVLTTEETQEIFLISKNGTDLRKIADGALPAWDPSGTKLLYVTDNTCQFPDRIGGTQCKRRIHLYDLLSRLVTTLPLELEREMIAPTWSADGLTVQWLTVETEPTKELSQQLLSFHTFHLGTENHQITLIAPLEKGLHDVAWSSDRTLFSFSYLNQIHLYLFTEKKAFALASGTEPQIAVGNTQIIYSRSADEPDKALSDIFLFDRGNHTNRLLVSHQTIR